MSDTMKPFLEPRSVALIGVPRAIGPEAYNTLENLLNAGFSGSVYPVNPKADGILGLRAYASILDIADNIDLAVISVSRSEVPRTVMECTRKDIRAITIVSQGFADADDEGRSMQEEIVRMARQGGARILGPNTWGTANPFNNFSSGFTPLVLERIPVGLIAQTGFYCGHPEVAGKFIDLGNACDINFADGLEYFDDDPDTKVILLHIEGIGDARKFMEMAARVSIKKPIAALKTGSGEQGAKAAQSHTGSLVGNDEIYEAAFRQCGVTRVRELHEFEDLAKTFLKLPLMKGRRVGIITPTGGAGMMTIDLVEKHRLSVAQLSTATLDRMNSLAPTWQRVGNPADIWPSSMIAGHPLEEVFLTALDSMLQDENVDGVMVLMPAFVGRGEQTKLTEIVNRGREKPIVGWPDRTAGQGEQLAVTLEETGNVVLFPSIERALRALSCLNERWQYLSSIEQGA